MLKRKTPVSTKTVLTKLYRVIHRSYKKAKQPGFCQCNPEYLLPIVCFDVTPFSLPKYRFLNIVLKEKLSVIWSADDVYMPKELRSKIMPKVFALLEKQGFKHIQTSKSPYTAEFMETQVLLKHETKGIYIWLNLNTSIEISIASCRKEESTVNKLIDMISSIVDQELQEKDKSLSITVWFADYRGLVQRCILARCPEEIVFDLPFLPLPNATFIKDYLYSRAPILILFGAPGTGKSFFAQRICFKFLEEDQGGKVHFISNPEVLIQDEFWYEVLGTRSLLVIDDATDILQSREEASGSIVTAISKLLSYSEGLLGYNTKIVLTTNRKIKNVDSALVRDGRCFGVVEFRKINFKEAKTMLSEKGIKLHLEEDLFPMPIASFLEKIRGKCDYKKQVDRLTEKVGF